MLSNFIKPLSMLSIFNLILFSSFYNLICCGDIYSDSDDNNNNNNNSNIEEGLNSLKLINVLFRHGDRSPKFLYPNDPHINYKWRGGLGALSQKGTLQMFTLGRHLRMRYKKLIPLNGLYSNKNMQVISSSVERCTMSASSFLAGFMPPLRNYNSLPIQWQPIPIFTIPRDRDHYLLQFKSCPKYDEIWNKIRKNPPDVIEEFNQKNADLYSYLTYHTGKNFSHMFDVEVLHNTLDIERKAGLLLPNWTENIFPEKTLPIFEMSAVTRTHTFYMKKIRGGAILTEFLNNIEHFKLLQQIERTTIMPTTTTPINKSIFIYSGHDTTIVSLFRVLDVIEQTTMSPDYATTIVLELHQNEIFVDDYEVKIVYYRNSQEKFPKELILENCMAPCSLTNFTKSFEQYKIYDYDDICKL